MILSLLFNCHDLKILKWNGILRAYYFLYKQVKKAGGPVTIDKVAKEAYIPRKKQRKGKENAEKDAEREGKANIIRINYIWHIMLLVLCRLPSPKRLLKPPFESEPRN